MDFVEFILGYVRLLLTAIIWGLALWGGWKIGPKVADWITRK